MTQLSNSQSKELIKDILISSKPRVTRENAKQFGRLVATLHLALTGISDDYVKEQITDAKNIVAEIWEDLNGC
tara:strand:- start:1086 stop:1304 length:219 start_codon:yes stop_codon:yes gene_type:complete